MPGLSLTRAKEIVVPLTWAVAAEPPFCGVLQTFTTCPCRNQIGGIGW